jgi:hypothetical protein
VRPQERLGAPLADGHTRLVEDEPLDDTTLIMEALLEIREQVRYIVRLLEDENGEEEEEDA